jgi:hypothetical protein
MARTPLFSGLVVGVVAWMALPVASFAERSNETPPGAWRFRTEKASSQTYALTVTRSGDSTWFLARDETGKSVRVVFPTRFGSVERDHRLVAAYRLRPGDRVEVSGWQRGGTLFTNHVRVVGE